MREVVMLLGGVGGVGLIYNTYMTIHLYKSNKKLIEENDKLTEDKKTVAMLFTKEKEKLVNQISILEEKEEVLMMTKSTIKKEKIVYDPIYKGKKAIIGNYDSYSSESTRRILRSLGFKVEVVRTGEDLVCSIESGNKYDIIFTNNTYLEGKYNDGRELLNHLRSIENFNTPVVVHTIRTGERNRFIDFLGFDEYIEKPVELEKVVEVLKKLIKTNKRKGK